MKYHYFYRFFTYSIKQDWAQFHLLVQRHYTC